MASLKKTSNGRKKPSPSADQNTMYQEQAGEGGYTSGGSSNGGSSHGKSKKQKDPWEESPAPRNDVDFFAVRGFPAMQLSTASRTSHGCMTEAPKNMRHRDDRAVGLQELGMNAKPVFGASKPESRLNQVTASHVKLLFPDFRSHLLICAPWTSVCSRAKPAGKMMTSMTCESAVCEAVRSSWVY